MLVRKTLVIVASFACVQLAVATPKQAPSPALSATSPKGRGAYQHHVRLTPENSAIGNFPAQKSPILTIKSGETVRIDTGGGAGWRNPAVDPATWLKEHKIPATTSDPAIAETIAVLEKTTRYADIANGHLLVGPIAVDGAMPGDSLEVRILSVVPRIPYGTTGRAPGRGLKQLPEGQERPPAKVTLFDEKKEIGKFGPGVDVPLGPFMGVMAVLPPDSDGPNRRSGPPGLFAGNLDCKELVAGTTLYIPIFHPGALFFTGDAHAVQGDGEITGTAIETAKYRDPHVHPAQGQDTRRAARGNAHTLHRLRPRPGSRQCDADGRRRNRAAHEGTERLGPVHRAAAREHGGRLSRHANRRRHEGRTRHDFKEAVHRSET